MNENVADLVDSSTFAADGTIGFNGREITGVRVVLEWCARAILSPAVFWATTAPRADLRSLQFADLTATQLERARMTYTRAIAGVYFVAKVRSTLTVDPSGNAAFNAQVTIEGAGTYPLAVNITAALAVLVTFPETTP